MPKANVSKSDAVIQFNGKNQEAVLDHSDFVQAYQSVDGLVLTYSDGDEAKVIQPGQWVGLAGVYSTLDDFDSVDVYEQDPEPEPEPEPEVVSEPVVEPEAPPAE